MVSEAGEPVEFSVAPASEADVKVFKDLDLELPEGATIHADKGYTDYHYEDLLEEVGVRLLSQRKKRSKRPHSACTEFLSKAHPPIHRDGLQQAECVIFKEDPCGYAKGLRVEDRLLPSGLLDSVPLGGNSG